MTAGIGDEGTAQMSSDGSVIVFASNAPDLVEGDDNNRYDVFAYEAASGAILAVSRALDGTVAGGTSRLPAVSADGQQVAFTSSARDIMEGAPGSDNVYLRRVTF